MATAAKPFKPVQLPGRPVINPGLRHGDLRAQVGQVVIEQEDGTRSITAELGEAVPKIASGGSGAELVQRSGRTSLVWWNGREPAKVAFTIVFDQRFEGSMGTSVERDCRIVEYMHGIGLDDDEPPPIVLFDSANLVPLDMRDVRADTWRWVIDTLEPQDTVRNDLGHATFQTYDVTMLRWVADDSLRWQSEALARRKAAATTPAKKKAKKVTYVVKRGDTLVGIASRHYHDVDRWRDIARANHISDPRAPLKVGRVLTLP